jgi:MoaA/NifB/PqqE/SkfB family radical SAM enzyme
MTTADQDLPITALPVPEAVPNGAAYQTERELALAYSARRRENYDRYQASDRRQAVVDYRPVRLDFENVSRCNFRCTMCQVSDWPKGRRADDMSFDDFKAIIDQQYGLVEIKLQGMGEPTIQGDDFFRMIAYARSQSIWVRSVTNASLLHLKDNYKKLIDSGVNELQISVDGADEETFTAIRRGAVFAQVMENCKLINGYCREKGIDRTKMWTVVQKANRHQMADLVRLAAELGFSNMVFSLNLTDWGSETWRERNDAVTVESSFSYAEGLELIALGDKVGVRVRFWTVTDKYDTDTPEHLCPWPFERGYVSSDLRAVPCCIIANPEASDLGDARDFNATWFGETWRQFRQDHLDGNIPAVCKCCYKAPAQP